MSDDMYVTASQSSTKPGQPSLDDEVGAAPLA